MSSSTNSERIRYFNEAIESLNARGSNYQPFKKSKVSKVKPTKISYMPLLFISGIFTGIAIMLVA